MRLLKQIVILSMAWAAVPAQAQDKIRTLELPATSSWQHAATGLILPPVIAGLSRRSVGDIGTEEMDVVAEYSAPGEGLVATLYLFKTMLPDTAIWFDRALAAILSRPELGLEGGSPPVIGSFSRPGSSIADGLKASLAVPRSSTKATAIALVPVTPGWLFKIRLSSDRLDAAALDQRLTAILSGTRWPAANPAAKAFSPIADCDQPLKLRKAKLIRPTMEQVLVTALLSIPTAKSADAGARYCREPGGPSNYGVYRPNGSRSAYVIALGDAGIALQLSPSMDINSLQSGSSRNAVAMTRLGRDSVGVLVSFNRLPPPDQAVAMTKFGGPAVSLTVQTKTD